MHIFVPRQTVMAALLLVLLAACSPQAETEMSEIKFLSSDFYRQAGLPFSEVVEVDGWLYLSGVIGNLPGTLDLAPGGIEGEARQIMATIKTTLERHGSSLNRVVKCTVMIGDMADWPAFNEVYKEYFDENYPARSAFGANGLALGAAVEVECVARR